MKKHIKIFITITIATIVIVLIAITFLKGKTLQPAQNQAAPISINATVNSINE